ncbi:response regulator [uncultured Jannaschia sp.]|uniref:response regulator n=1 Tax=uncultured Jannaschia sp. TaxID=293347 RepID=UPI002631B506|nr:response regulator [uncultured Jannaschia sp.]
MDGTVRDDLYIEERRRRLAAERKLEHTRRELSRAHAVLTANADRLSRDCVAERERSLRLAERRRVALAAQRRAAERADHARRRLWHAIETMRDGFALFDAEGCLVVANHVYLELFDGVGILGPGDHISEIYDHAVVEGVFDTGEMDPDEWVAEQIARWDEPSPPPLHLTHYDGRAFRIEDRHVPDGDIVSVAIDITEHRTREAALAAARDAAESTASVKTQFLARIGHEIRTPMSGVLGLAQMLADQAADAETRLSARTICESAEALLGIVDDALDVSRLDENGIALRDAPFDLEALLCDSVRLAIAEARPGVTVALGYPLGARTRFRGDGARVRQIVSHLLGNAVRVTERGHVILQASVAGGDPARVVLEVEDTGPGIASEDQSAVFEAFAQTPDPDRPAREGTGLGLTIARGLAERMGGTLTVRSAPGAGATFVLALPLVLDGPAPDAPALPGAVAIPDGVSGDVLAARLDACGATVTRRVTPASERVILLLDPDGDRQRAALAALAPGARLVVTGRRADALPETLSRADILLPAPVRGAELIAALAWNRTDAVPPPALRILVVDDNATNRLIADRMLAGEGYAVELASGGIEALAAFEARTPDAVILDISMPDMDGFEVAVAMRRSSASVPIVALTAHVGAEIAERLARAGFDAYLTKPLRKAELLAELARHFRAG